MLRIKDVLWEKGMTQAELARLTNTHKQYINALCSNRISASIGRLEYIARILDVKVCDLIC